jgi:hypothetical protein
VHPNSGVVFAVAIGTIAAFLSLASDALTGEEITFTSRHYLSGGHGCSRARSPARPWRRQAVGDRGCTSPVVASTMSFVVPEYSTNSFSPATWACRGRYGLRHFSARDQLVRALSSISEAKDIALAERVEEALYLCIGQRDGDLSSTWGLRWMRRSDYPTATISLSSSIKMR